MSPRLEGLGSRLLLLATAGLTAVLALAPVAAAEEQPDPGDSHPCEDVPSWLQPACHLASGASNADGLIDGAIASGAESALRSIVEWVVGGAAWLLGQLVGLIDSTARPDVTQDWFSVAYGDMVMIAVLMMLPLLVVSAIQAVLRQSLAHLLKAAFVYVPVACIGMFAAVTVVDQLVILTDELSGWIGRSTGNNLTEFAENVSEVLVVSGMATGNSSAGATLPGFATLLAAIVIAFASFVLWVLLVLRQAAIYIAVLFLPLAFSALVWPVTAHWLRRLLEGLIAIISSKFVIVAVLSLASGAMNAIGDEGFPVLISGGALLLLAAFAPFVLLRLIPVFESGLASQLDGTTTTRTSPVPVPTAGGVYRGVQWARAASAARGAGALAGPGAPAAMAGATAAAGGGRAMSTIARRTVTESVGATTGARRSPELADVSGTGAGTRASSGQAPGPQNTSGAVTADGGTGRGRTMPSPPDVAGGGHLRPPGSGSGGGRATPRDGGGIPPPPPTASEGRE